MRDMSPEGKAIYTLKLIDDIEAGAFRIKHSDEKKSLEVLKDSEIDVAHNGCFHEEGPTLFVDVKNIEKAIQLLEAENITTNSYLHSQ